MILEIQTSDAHFRLDITVSELVILVKTPDIARMLDGIHIG